MAVFNAIKSVQDGTFKGGTDVIANVEERRRRPRQDRRRRARSTPTRSRRSRTQIAAGKIKDIPDTVK